MFQRFFAAVCFCIIANYASSQSNVSIYTSFKKGDSTNLAVDLLSSELKNAINVDFSISRPGDFRNKGILILTTNQAKENKISFPASLASMRPEGIYVKAEPGFLTIIGNTGLALQ